jgi:hypothetical protein
LDMFKYILSLYLRKILLQLCGIIDHKFTMTLIQRKTVFSLVLVSNNGWMNGPGGVYVDFLPLDFNVLSMTFFLFFLNGYL